MSCCDGIIKYLLFFFNFLFSLTGLALIILGGITLSNINYGDFLGNVEMTKTSQITVIVLGCIIFFIATLGCCGAIRENRCMLLTFGCLLLGIFIIQLAIGIYAITHKEDILNKIEVGLRKEFDQIKYNPDIRKTFDKIQTSLECCGVVGPQDYVSMLMPVPESCCEDKSNCRVRPGVYWNRGCAKALTSVNEKGSEALGALTIGLTVVELLGAIFAFRLAGKYR